MEFTEPMETMSEATARLQAAGYTVEFTASPGGLLRCGACGAEHLPGDLTIDETVRFEGMTDPSDEAIALALRCPCGAAGLYTPAFGPDVTAEDAEVLRALPR